MDKAARAQQRVILRQHPGYIVSSVLAIEMIDRIDAAEAERDAARAEAKRYRKALVRAHRALGDAAYRLGWDADYLGEQSAAAKAAPAAAQARDDIEAVLEGVESGA